jgi:hypothetical protein
MLDGRQRHDWSIAASHMAVLANLHRDPKRTRPLTAADFDPFHARRALPKVPVSVLKDVFINGQMPATLKEYCT